MRVEAGALSPINMHVFQGLEEGQRCVLTELQHLGTKECIAARFTKAIPARCARTAVSAACTEHWEGGHL